MTSSFTVIPPSCASDKIVISLRGGLKNDLGREGDFRVSFYLDEIAPGKELHTESARLSSGEAKLIKFRVLSSKLPLGEHVLIMLSEEAGRREIHKSPLCIEHSEQHSINRLSGAWNGFYHWSEEEGRLWNSDIKKLTAGQWREQVRGMKEIGLDVVVIQEMFRNQEYYDNHKIPETGYKGKAYYPSKLFPGRMEIACDDPLEAVLSEADKLDMKVFPGIGMYAWFDYTAGSLEWHKKAASEIWSMYGHHPSFYGFYVSEEGGGDLGGTDKPKQERIVFFKELKAHCKTLAPDKPMMLAPNCWYVKNGLDCWPELLKHLDIVCPFAFHRMNEDDISGEESAQIFQDLCDKAGVHLWMDMELFLFDKAGALYPRPLEGLLSDLRRFPNFEKILGYQYQGIMCAPQDSCRLGGDDAVRLFNEYKNYLAAQSIKPQGN